MSDSSPRPATLLHRTVYDDNSLITKQLPLADSLRVHHPNGFFPLIQDPTVEKKTTIIGMFVLRPAESRAYSSPLLHEGIPTDSVFAADLDWCYNVDGLDGGWLIANSNGIDAYRLGMQYGVTDAVIIGTNTVSTEGVTHDSYTGYIWQPYGPLSWGQVASADPNIHEKVNETRKLWQDMGYLSKRNYPAQVVFTWTGLKYDGCADFLDARIFNEKHPTGENIEVYIITSELGAERIRERSKSYPFADRIESMLIVVPPPAGDDDREHVDLTVIPKILFEKYDMRIVNHDGGHKVLKAFCKAGIIAQMNLTLCRKYSVKDVIRDRPDINDSTRKVCQEEFLTRRRLFFGTKTSDGQITRGVPSSMKIASVIEDPNDEVSIFVFDTKRGLDFYQE